MATAFSPSSLFDEECVLAALSFFAHFQQRMLEELERARFDFRCDYFLRKKSDYASSFYFAAFDLTIVSNPFCYFQKQLTTHQFTMLPLHAVYFKLQHKISKYFIFIFILQQSDGSLSYIFYSADVQKTSILLEKGVVAFVSAAYSKFKESQLILDACCKFLSALNPGSPLHLPLLSLLFFLLYLLYLHFHRGFK
jgi:hypothetical protein